MTFSINRRMAAIFASVAAVGSTAATMAPSAHAAERRLMCAENATVRQFPGNYPVGQLLRTEAFDLDHYSPSGAYAVGYAYGGEGPDGKGVAGAVLANTITDANGHCQSPYPDF